MEPIIESVRQIIAKVLKIPVERLAPDTALQNIGVESLDLIEIIFALEEKFNISIPYNANETGGARPAESTTVQLNRFETISQISMAVQRLVNARTPA